MSENTKPPQVDESNTQLTNPDTISLSLTHSNGSTTEYHLTESQAAKLKDSLGESIQNCITTPDNILRVGRSDSNHNITKHPYHLHGEFGCVHNQTATNYVKELNLAELSDLPENRTNKGLPPTLTQERWVENENTEGILSIEEFIDKFVCVNCSKSLDHWHQQRKFFLPLLSSSIHTARVDYADFNIQKSQPSSCSTCGTPKSAIYRLIRTNATEPLFDEQDNNSSNWIKKSQSKIQAKTDITTPIRLCATCVDLLVDANPLLPFDANPIENHPYNESRFPMIPITNPNFKKPNKIREEQQQRQKEKHMSQMERTDFIAIVKEFDSAGKTIAEKLWNNGFQSITKLTEANKNELMEVPFVGRGISESIREEAQEELSK